MGKQLQIIFIPVLMLFMIFLARSLTLAPPSLLLAGVVLLFVVFFCFIQQDMAAVVLILSMILSPEFVFSELKLRQASVRLDDIILFTFFISWLFKMAFTKNLTLIKFTPLNKPLLIYIFVAIFCTWYSYFTKQKLNPLSAVFHIIKYLEYFMIYFMFTNITTTKKQISLYMKALFLGALVVSIYGYFQIFTDVARISAPFEGKAGEANTFGGYLLIILGQTWMAFILPNRNIHKVYSLVASILLLILIIYTYSRSTYVAFFGLLFSSFLFATQKQRIGIFVSSVLLCFVLPSLIPTKAVERTTNPFMGKTETVVTGISVNPEDSLYNRLKAIELSISLWENNTLFGRGVSGAGVVDNQYFRIIGEMGLLGLLIFFWIIYSVFGAVNKTLTLLTLYEPGETLQYRIIVLGFLCAFVSLLIHALGTNSFLIIRIMEPFWFLVAMVVKIPDILESDRSVSNKPYKYSDEKWLQRKYV